MNRCGVLLIFAASLALAQTKPTLKPADYGRWETLGAATLSPDGHAIAYEIRRVDGDNELRVGTTADSKSKAIAFCNGPAFSADSKWLACISGVSETEQERARKANRPLENKLQILDVASGAVTTIDGVQSFAFSLEGEYLAFRHYGANRENAASAGGRGGNGGGGRGGRGGGAAASENDPAGTALVVRNLATNVDTTFGNVTSYSWADK